MNAGPLIGRQLGAYRISSLLGAGGMGEVYRAHDSRLGRDVALKILPFLVSATATTRSRFEREARALAALNHRNVATIHGVQDADGVLAIVMELVEGQTLADKLTQAKGGRLSVAESLGIARQIASGIEAAHEKGIVHRDLKPANIKVTPDGTVKVLDFGLAKATGHELDATDGGDAATAVYERTQEGLVLGTATYMSPEQARGEAVDKRTDIWAFGCVLFEMLAGRRAFPGRTISDIVSAIIEREPVWSDLPADTPAPVRRVLERCLQKDPRRRLRDIGDLDALLDVPLEVASGNAAASARARSPRLAWGIAAASVALAVLLAVLYGTASLNRPPDVAAYQTSILPPDGHQFLNAGVVRPPGRFALSPDGRRLAFVAVDASGTRRLWVRRLDASQATLLPGTGNAAFPFWSPDSRLIAFQADRTLKIIDANTGPPTAVTAWLTINSPGVWTAGGILFSPETNGGFFRVAPREGAVPARVLGPPDGHEFNAFPFLLPDGRQILFSSGTQGGKSALYAATLDSGTVKQLLAQRSNTMFAEGHLLFLRGQSLVAQPFDTKRLEVAGDAVTIAENIAVGGNARIVGAFSVSNNGVLAFQTGSAAENTPLSHLAWFDRQGKQVGLLGDPGEYGDVEISPDGKLVAVAVRDATTSTQDVWVFDAARGVRERLTFDPAIDSSPIWSPDGSRMLFASERRGEGDLYEIVLGQSGNEAVMLADDRDKMPTSWSPDGRLVMFAINRGTARDLWMLPLGGDRKPFLYTQTPFRNESGRFSPDGRWIAFTSNESGTQEVYAQPFPGPGRKQRVSTSGGSFPRWSRDGKELFYLTLDGTLTYATVSSDGATLRVADTRSLFQSHARTDSRYGYDVSPDGQRFLINVVDNPNESVAAPPITLVVNWPALLKK